MKMTHSGCCLCGSVKFQVIGEATRFRYCHCQRCRKSTGSGHASNILVSATGINWTSGVDNRSSYTVVDSNNFTRDFCKTCGSPLPNNIPEIKAVLIPAGLLDTEPDIKPQARIFQNSRASWSCNGDDLPCYDEYPE